MYSFTKREQIVILVVVFIIMFGLFFRFVLLDKVSAKKTKFQIVDQEIESETLGNNLEVSQAEEQEIADRGRHAILRHTDVKGSRRRTLSHNNGR